MKLARGRSERFLPSFVRLDQVPLARVLDDAAEGRPSRSTKVHTFAPARVTAMSMLLVQCPITRSAWCHRRGLEPASSRLQSGRPIH